MHDHPSRYAERAKAWVKEFEPSKDELRDAYVKMKAKSEKDSSVDPADCESCLEYLIEAYQSAGGNVDDLLALEEGGSMEQPSVDYKFDASPLCAVEAEVVLPKMTRHEKQEQFAKLKEMLKKSA